MKYLFFAFRCDCLRPDSQGHCNRFSLKTYLSPVPSYYVGSKYTIFVFNFSAVFLLVIGSSGRRFDVHATLAPNGAKSDLAERTPNTRWARHAKAAPKAYRICILRV